MSASEVFTTLMSRLGELHRGQAARQQVVRHRQLHQVDRLTLDVGELLAGALEHHAVVAIGVVADDQRRGIHAARGGNGQHVHVGHHAGVELARGVLVDRLDVVVDLRELDLDAVLVGPLLEDAALLGVVPGHPADVDAPGHLERGFFRGPGGLRHHQRQGERRGQQARSGTVCARARSSLRSRIGSGA